MMMRFSTFQNKTMMVSDLFCFRSVSTLLLRSVLSRSVLSRSVLSRSPTIMLLMMMIIMLCFTSPISSSFTHSSTEKVTNEVSIIQKHDIVLDEPTLRTIDKLYNRNDDEQQQQSHNHGDDDLIMTKDVAVFQHHRMTQDCVNTEDELRNAIKDANSRSSTPTIINLCEEYIYMNSQIIVDNKSIQFNCIILSNPSYKCTLDVQKNDRHFLIENSIVLFKQLIFINGNVSNSCSNCYDGDGGSLYITDESNVEIIDCYFFTNEAIDDGGAIYIFISISEMINVIMRDNKSGYGGAIRLSYSNVTMINNIMTNNVADYFGGAVDAVESNLTILNSILTKNTATAYGGGALKSSSITSSSIVVVLNTSLTSNTAPFGGAVYSYNSNLDISNSILTKNTATVYGGAVYSTTSTLIVTKSNLSDNTATSDGTCLYSDGVDDIAITDSVAYNNNPKSLCEIYNDDAESRIEISGEILLQSQTCHVFPNPKPSSAPSRAPSKQPALIPSSAPLRFFSSETPSVKPSKQPSSVPSRAPSKRPSAMPSVKKPSKQPSSVPSRAPSKRPSSVPSRAPSKRLSAMPSVKPSKQQSSVPSRAPSKQLSAMPSVKPSKQPSSVSSSAPSKSPSAPIPVPTNNPTSCLSGRNIVNEKNIGYISLDKVKVGDYIQSSNGKFTQVYGFGHRDPHDEIEFLQFNYQSETVAEFSFLEVSTAHIVYMDRNNQNYLIRASDVVIGDKLNGMIVEKIQYIVRRGVYAPLTYSGDFMVNGVIVSNYIDVLDHDFIWHQHIMGHVLFFPQRIFCSYFMEICKKEKYIDGYGYLAYIIIRGTSIVQQGLYFVNNMIVLVAIGFVVGILVGVRYLSRSL